MNPLCAAEGIGLIPWSPLARGFLAGNRSRDGGGETTRAQSDAFAQSWYYRDNDFEIVERVVEVARRLEVKPAQVALAWLLQRPGIVGPIIGASKMQHLEDAVAALEVQLSAVHAALAFYEENREEIDRHIREGDAFFEAGLRVQEHDPIYQGLKARREAVKATLSDRQRRILNETSISLRRTR